MNVELFFFEISKTILEKAFFLFSRENFEIFILLVEYLMKFKRKLNFFYQKKKKKKKKKK